MKETPAEAAAILAKGSEALDALFSKLSADAAEARGTIGGGAWSACDLAGHLATWEEVALRTIEEIRAGRPPSIRDTVTDEASLDRFNAAEVERRASIGWEETLTNFRATNTRLVATVRAIPDDDWERVAPSGFRSIQISAAAAAKDEGTSSRRRTSSRERRSWLTSATRHRHRWSGSRSSRS